MSASWHPTPSPYNEGAEHRPPPQDIGHQPLYGPPQPYPPPSRDGPNYATEPAYNRQGSASATTRSPAEPSQQHYHPPVTNNHEPSYYPPPGHPDYRQRHPYGAPEGQPNGTHPSLHVSTGHDMMGGQPGVPPSHYAPPSSAGPPPTPSSFYYDYGQQRRKPVRAAQACDSCRQRKAKCDEGRPECQHCKDNGLKCSYREIPPQKSEKQVMQMTERLENLNESVNMLIQNSKVQSEQIDKLLRMQQLSFSSNTNSNSFLESTQDDRKATPKPITTDTAQTDMTQRPTMSHYKSEDSQVAQQMPQNLNESFSSAAGDTTGQVFEEGALEFALPPKHTTGASHLFNWPSIKQLIPKNMKTSYVMDTELDRGLLRLYGCGEGEDKGDGHEGVPSPAGSSSSEGRRFDDEISSISPHGVWGNGQLPAPPTSNQTHSAREHAGGVSPSGGLMLDSEAVDKYFRSYMENMHILHPFLEPKVLKNMLYNFKRKYSWDFRMQQPMHAAIGAKRKRERTDSPTPVDDFNAHPQQNRNHGRQPSTIPVIEHSVANAIILLIIALGKVCSHREPLPGPATTSSFRTSTPHTMYSDLPMPMSAPSSPFGNQPYINGSQPMPAPGPSNLQGRNMDTIPGLAYFAKAADIIGELPGGVDVSHVQANLLAGLFMGQLARVFPSYFYISNACKACQILIESTAYTTPGGMKDSRRNLINFAFWSCLQLESDILAEVDLPPSGITRYESVMHEQIPTGITLHGIPEMNNPEDILKFYSHQIQLRRTMNSVHSILYKYKKSPTEKPSLTIISILNQNLDDWRDVLKDWDWDWDENDYQSDNINVARMRAKFYGAKYIIHRPAIRYALSLPVSSSTPSTRYSDSPSAPAHGSELSSPALPHNYATSAPTQTSRDMKPPSKGSASSSNIPQDLLEAARACVQAAIRSTTSFDSVRKRPVVTNIFGTAHAQFGNMLVLSATYMSGHPEISSLIDAPTLKRLFERTIRILQDHENISPVLGKDARILLHVRQNVFPKEYPPVGMVY